MAKYIFSSKFKKIEREPLYYNIQVSVDKDFYVSNDMYGPGFEFQFYADTPILLKRFENIWHDDNKILLIHKPMGFTNLNLNDSIFFTICESEYPFPDVIQVVYERTTFTFTPIPVYE